LIIAIDGPGGSGKSTVARSVARRLGFTYIDSGAMYRAVALWALRLGMDLDDLHRLEQLAKEARIELPGDRVLLNGEDVTAEIRDPKVSDAASRVAAQPGVRRAMREEQRRIGSAGP
jgi:CMP/dCMP kinase